MHPKLLDILSRKEVPIENEQLARYLKGELDDAARHELERKMEQGGEMEQDAWEGWQHAGKQQILQHAEEINRHLERQLFTPSRRARKRPIKDLPLTWWMMGLVLILLLLAWGIIQFLHLS